MKYIISLVVALATTGITAKCLGEAAVYLNNYDLNRPIYYWDPRGKVLAPMGTSVLISGGAVGAALTPIGAAFGLTEPGYFDNGFGMVAGVADNANVDLKLEATYEKSGIVTKGFAIWSQTAGANPGAPTLPTPAILALPVGIAMGCPEPSSAALTLLGGGVLLWLFRRK